jgi:hypothetical protein
MKLQPQVNQSGEVVGYCHWCEACESIHCFRIEHPFNANGPTWKFDGNMDSPSFHPSMRLFTGHKNSPNTVCHYFVKGGMIDYCNDSPHRLRGQKIELLHVDVVLAERQARYAHEALVDERFRALVQLDLEWARKAMPGETGDEVRLVAMHRARYENDKVPPDFRIESGRWLRERGLLRSNLHPVLEGDKLPT